MYCNDVLPCPDMSCSFDIFTFPGNHRDVSCRGLWPWRSNYNLLWKVPHNAPQLQSFVALQHFDWQKYTLRTSSFPPPTYFSLVRLLTRPAVFTFETRNIGNANQQVTCCTDSQRTRWPSASDACPGWWGVWREGSRWSAPPRPLCPAGWTPPSPDCLSPPRECWLYTSDSWSTKHYLIV